jgi:hypothetical protein
MANKEYRIGIEVSLFDWVCVVVVVVLVLLGWGR